jgi:hypothetical protein
VRKAAVVHPWLFQSRMASNAVLCAGDFHEMANVASKYQIANGQG